MTIEISDIFAIGLFAARPAAGNEGAHYFATDAVVSGVTGVMYRDSGVAWVAEGHSHSGFATSSHAHAGSDITSGTVADARVASTLARDSEVTTAVSDHEAASDPHTGYQRESEKAAASGYASLDGSTKVPIAQLPTGSTSSTVAIGNDSRLSDARTPSDHGHTTGGDGGALATPEVTLKLLMDEQGSNPANPAAGKWVLFVKSGGVFAKNSSGTVVGPLVDAAGSGGLTSGTPGLTLGTTNAAGAASTGIATDATIALFDATVPVTQAFSDAAATGSAAKAARRDHVHGMPASPSSSLTTADATLSGDVTLTTANTFYDGPSASCAAGTWLFAWKALTQSSGSPVTFRHKLWDGSTIWDEAEDYTNQNGFRATVTGFAIVVLGSTTTVKLSVSGDANSQTLKRDGGVGANHYATRLSGVKVA